VLGCGLALSFGNFSRSSFENVPEHFVMGQLELALLLARVFPRTAAHVYVSPAVERHLPEGARREPRRSSRQAQRRRKIGCEVAVRPLRKVIDGAAIAVA